VDGWDAIEQHCKQVEAARKQTVPVIVSVWGAALIASAFITVQWTNHFIHPYRPADHAIVIKAAEDAIKQYSLLSDDGNGGEICVRAKAVVSAWMQAGDPKAYAYWEGIVSRVCIK
jgi:hypothetical protein